MHDPKYQAKVKKYWRNWLPQPFGYLLQYFLEGQQYNFSELTVIKNYIGPKHAFFFAWLSFYTTWLLPIALLGLAIAIYDMASTGDQYVNLSYVFVLMIWLAVVIERWK